MSRYLVIAAVAVLALVGAFVGGRFSAPLKVETREIGHVIYKDRVVEVVKTVEVKGKTETKIVYREIVRAPDGTVTEREKEETKTKEDTKRTDDGEKTAERESDSKREAVAVTTSRPDWRVGVLLGGSLRDPLVPIAGPLVLGLSVERRLIGGLSAGLWINTFGAAGVGLSFEF